MKMKLNKISLEFDREELEAIHYAMNIGIRKYKKDKCHTADNWINIAESIRMKLPIELRLRGELWIKNIM